MDGMSRHLLYAVLLWAVCGWAVVRGGRSERVAGIGILADAVMSAVVMRPMQLRYHNVETAVLMVDLTLFALLFALAMRSSKYWPLWMAGMEGVSLLGHLTPLMPGVIAWAYSNAVQLWAWPMLGLLAYATWAHRKQSIGRIGRAGW
jgi:F0F1-type ATP synthase membrane subunit c/vacuolar-type H+-ATPase subunit K